MINVGKYIHDSWKVFPGWNMMGEILGVINPEIVGKNISPMDPENIFRAFSMPIDKLKVLWVAEHPYKQIATGIAYGVEPETPIKDYPTSLYVLTEALSRHLSLSMEQMDKEFMPSMRMLFDDGQMLINAAFTCNNEDPKSHVSYWDPFTVELLKWIDALPQKILVYFIGEEQKVKFSKYIQRQETIFSNHPISELTFKHKFSEIEQFFYAHYGNSPCWVLPF